MFSHVTVGTDDLERARVFYTAVFAPLGVELQMTEPDWLGFGPRGAAMPSFFVLHPLDGNPPSVGNGTMTAFNAQDARAVDAVHAAALSGGGRCEGPPGLRPHYHADYYGAYFRDPDGNKLHVVCHAGAG